MAAMMLVHQPKNDCLHGVPLHSVEGYLAKRKRRPGLSQIVTGSRVNRWFRVRLVAKRGADSDRVLALCAHPRQTPRRASRVCIGYYEKPGEKVPRGKLYLAEVKTVRAEGATAFTVECPDRTYVLDAEDPRARTSRRGIDSRPAFCSRSEKLSSNDVGTRLLPLVEASPHTFLFPSTRVEETTQPLGEGWVSGLTALARHAKAAEDPNRPSAIRAQRDPRTQTPPTPKRAAQSPVDSLRTPPGGPVPRKRALSKDATPARERQARAIARPPPPAASPPPRNYRDILTIQDLEEEEDRRPRRLDRSRSDRRRREW